MTPDRTPKSRSRKKAPTLSAIARSEKPGQVWFSRNGCVVRQDGRVEVFIDGSLLASYEECETGIRNAVLMLLAKKEAVVLEKLAEAFGITSEALRLIRKVHETEGLDAVIRRRRGGNHRKPKVTLALRRRMEAWFEQGLSVSEVHERLRGKLSRATVGNVRKSWGETKAADAGHSAEPEQQMLNGIASASATSAAEAEVVEGAPRVPAQAAPGAAAEAEAEVEVEVEVEAPRQARQDEGVEARDAAGGAALGAVAGEEAQSRPDSRVGAGEVEASQPAAADTLPDPNEGRGPATIRAPRTNESARAAHGNCAGRLNEVPSENEVAPGEPVSRRSVQALGSWLLVAMVSRFGFYERARTLLVEGLGLAHRADSH